MTGEQAVFTAREARRYLRMGERSFTRHVKAGRIPCWVDQDTGWRRYPKASLDLFLASFADHEKAS